MAYYPRLRDLREDADLTQDELVKQLGMHKTTYTNYEQGKRGNRPLNSSFDWQSSTAFPSIISPA